MRRSASARRINEAKLDILNLHPVLPAGVRFRVVRCSNYTAIRIERQDVREHKPWRALPHLRDAGKVEVSNKSNRDEENSQSRTS
jgi:hypothetical protein